MLADQQPAHDHCQRPPRAVLTMYCAPAGGVSSTAGSDTDLDAAKAIVQPSESLYDIAKLEFDVTPTQSGSLAWQFVFGSEEYKCVIQCSRTTFI